MLDADILAVQEAYAFQWRWLASGLPGFTGCGAGRSDGRHRGEHVGVFVRDARFDVLSCATRWLSATPERPGSKLPGARFPRSWTVAQLRARASGAAFDVIAVHLDERSAARRAVSARLLAEALRPDVPTIVLGDLNAEEVDDELAPLVSAGLRFALPPGAGGTAHRFTGRDHGRRIDHILVTDHWTVSTAEVLRDRPGGRLPSDHWPIAADLVLP